MELEGETQVSVCGVVCGSGFLPRALPRSAPTAVAQWADWQAGDQRSRRTPCRDRRHPAALVARRQRGGERVRRPWGTGRRGRAGGAVDELARPRRVGASVGDEHTEGRAGQAAQVLDAARCSP
jgi:hypothetical protein